MKHHLGYSGAWTTLQGRKVHISLCFNPSHLEYVDTVALGRMRAKQDAVGDTDRVKGMVILIHGEAAFAGEGVTQETLNLSELPAYRTGGTIHVIVNNQLGFTTPPEEARSSPYASDVAKMLQIPIFHVNGESPEAVAQVVALAMDFRRRFHRDVVIDMYAYRRRGHNEGDEPSFTQPLMYRAIEQRRSVRDSYLEHLLELGGVTREEAERIAAERRARLERDLETARREDATPGGDRIVASSSGDEADPGSESLIEADPASEGSSSDESPVPPADPLRGQWRGYAGGLESSVPEAATAVPRDRLSSLLDRLTRLPESFHPHPKIRRGLDHRREAAQGKRPLDWAAAEALAFATLATEGTRVRMTGQDTARGTFSQRHAVLHDVENGSPYVPLQSLAPDQAPVEIANSPLSESGVLGFEYGYSLDCPEGLIIWEAQFGDFCNAAQVIIDQFIVSAEQKWHRLSGLVLLLPHGFEGMGPEHSSARLERFLSLAAQDNIQVVNVTTPAQYFHLLRRQVLRRWRKPLVVMTPKSLLRHPRAVSSLEDLASGGFMAVIPDEMGPLDRRVSGGTGDRPDQERRRIEQVLLCSGKIFYDLAEHRREQRRDDVAIVRVEKLYPLPSRELSSALAAYDEGTPVVWVQEEPENMGAWHHVRLSYGERLLGRFPLFHVSRGPTSSPATGSTSSHKIEQTNLVERAFVSMKTGVSERTPWS